MPRDWNIEPDPARAVEGSECVVVAVPSKALREATGPLGDFKGIVISVTKGLEHETGLTMCGVLADTAPHTRRVALSGPTFALEVARGIPTACVAASNDPSAAVAAQQLFHTPAFRVYTSADLLGVELGGALKTSSPSRPAFPMGWDSATVPRRH